MLVPRVANFECYNLFNHDLTLLIAMLKAIYVKACGWKSDRLSPLCVIYFPFCHASQRHAASCGDNKLNMSPENHAIHCLQSQSRSAETIKTI